MSFRTRLAAALAPLLTVTPAWEPSAPARVQRVGSVVRTERLSDTVTLHLGDSRDVTLAGLDPVQAIVTDPPYALVSIAKRFGKAGAAPARIGATGAYARASAGFMGQTWDTGETAFDPEFWADVMALLVPGGHIVAASGTRTYHRLACAIEDAGFEIRDMISWLYGQGFPKSHDAGEGRGTALKPACEPWVLGRKPLIGTVAQNVLAHRTGALNIDACRVGVTVADASQIRTMKRSVREGADGWGMSTVSGDVPQVVRPDGRWPANVAHDGSDAVLAELGDPARFFYCAKASKADREEGMGGVAGRQNSHPTVKPEGFVRASVSWGLSGTRHISRSPCAASNTPCGTRKRKNPAHRVRSVRGVRNVGTDVRQEGQDQR